MKYLDEEIESFRAVMAKRILNMTHRQFQQLVTRQCFVRLLVDNLDISVMTLVRLATDFHNWYVDNGLMAFNLLFYYLVDAVIKSNSTHIKML